MLNRIKRYAFYGDTDKQSYKEVRSKIEENNRKIALVFASVATVLITIMLILSYSQEGFASSKPVYIFGIIFSVVQIIISLMAKKYNYLSYASVYMAISVFLIYGIAIATLTRPEEQTVTFMVMLIFVPLIFIDRPIRMAVVLTLYIIIFIAMAMKTKTGSVLSVDITDAAIFGLLSIVSETIVYRAKIRGFVLENKLKIMSETDQLTGLKNRNSYELRLESYKTAYENSICCIYVDINGLHELNNTKGHKAGDEMLCYIAAAFVKKFGMSDTYRVGGDEYVSFVTDMPLHEIEKRLKEVEEDISGKGYYAAVGCEFHEGKDLDVNKLIVDAESKMYINKSEYYKKHDRRTR